MSFRPTTLERAYQLAAGGTCRGVVDIKRSLRAEGFVAIDDQLYGLTTSKALRELCVEHYRYTPPVTADHGDPGERGVGSSAEDVTARA